MVERVAPQIQCPNKYKSTYLYILRKKEKGKNPSLTVRQGHIKHVCKNSGSIPQKRRGHWTLNYFGAISLNQPVYLFCPANHTVGRLDMGIPSEPMYWGVEQAPKKVEAGRVLEPMAVLVADVGWERGGYLEGERDRCSIFISVRETGPRNGQGVSSKS